MANQEHLESLQTDIREWNMRRKFEKFAPDLRDADLRNVDFSGADLSYADLSNAD